MSKDSGGNSKILQVARYLDTGKHSQIQIARTCHVSKNLVSVIQSVMAANGWTAADVEAMSEESRKQVFKRTDLPERAEKQPSIYAEPDYEYYCKELLKDGVTKSLLHEEYVAETISSGKIPLQLTQFKIHLNEHLRKKPYSEIIAHRPGEETEVDWVGDCAKWTDPDTGEVMKAWLFAGILPFSGYGYAEAFPDMKLPNWIAAHVHMYEYFGGVTRVLICDNLKTGVIKHPATDDIILQSDYEAFANHYGIIISPARVRKPDDKGHVENLCRSFETHILAKMRNFQCFSLEEYNREVRRQLDIFNARPFQKKEGSRLSVFTEYEKSELIHLPSVPYEYFVKKQAKVQNNCCISYGKNYYSVPYKYIGETVTLKVFNDRIEIYAGADLLCRHHLITGRTGFYDIDNTHLPPYSSRYGNWNSERIKKWAQEYGPNTYEVIDRIFRSGGAEQRYYNGTISLLKLADSYSPARVEQACQFALKGWKHPTYRNIKAILLAGQDLKYNQIPDSRNIDELQPREEKSHVRGAEYYAGKKDK